MLPSPLTFDGTPYLFMALRNPAGELMLAGLMRGALVAYENCDNAVVTEPVNQRLTAYPQDKLPAVVAALDEGGPRAHCGGCKSRDRHCSH